MEVSLYYPKSRALISCFTFPSSSSAISLSPVFKCRPPGLRWYNNSRKSRYKAQIPRCSLQDSIIERYLVAFAATAAAFAAIRVVFSYFAEKRKGHVSSLEVLDRKLGKDTTITEEIKHDAQNATNEVSHHITKPLEAESVKTQVAIFEEEDNHNTSEVLVSNLKEDNHNTSEILVSNLKEELEMNSISKAFAPVNALEFAVTHSEGSLVKPEYKEGRNTVAFIKEGPASKIKKLEKNYESKKTGGKNNKHFHNITNGKSNQFPLVNGFKKGSNDPKENLLIYNSLLKDGRLRDCVDLLENMENEGILNMEKIHHSSFLNACKSRKAIKEAIRFVKLIKKPKMSTFNMLLSVCASSQDSDGAYQVMTLLKEAGLRPDCKLYTTLISAFGKSGKVDTMFEVFHEMVNGGIEANVNTYGALIDGCARAGQVAKAFGAYGIMRSKNVVPDRVIFNALITTCGESGAVDRAFDVLSEMLGENIPVLPDHVTVGALIKTCINARMVDKAREVYKMLEEYEITGTVEVYTIAIRSCSLNGDLQFALQVYEDMKRKKIKPDEMFLSTLINVAGNAGNLEVAFKILNEARNKGTKVANISYSSLMGACCNAKNWEKALELYEEIKSKKITPAVSMMNALITALCENGQIVKSLGILEEMKKLGVQPNNITYTVLIIACEKNDEAELAFQIFKQAKIAEITITPTICGCLTGLCLQRYEKDSSLGNVSITFNLGKPQISNKWTSLAIDTYSEIISAGLEPKMDALSQVMGCMKFPNDSLSRNKIIENNLGFGFDVLNGPNISSLLDGFGEYDPRSFHILEEAAAKGMVNRLILEEPKAKGMGKKSSFKAKPLIVDARKLQLHIAQVYVIATLKTLKHHLAAGAILPTVSILLPTEKTQVELSKGKTLYLAGRIGQAVGSLLRKLGVKYKGGESHGKIIITGLTLKRWFEPKLDENTIPRDTFLGNGNTFLGNGNSFPGNGNTFLANESTFLGMIPNPTRLRKGIADQQRNIRSGTNLSFED